MTKGLDHLRSLSAAKRFTLHKVEAPELKTTYFIRTPMTCSETDQFSKQVISAKDTDENIRLAQWLIFHFSRDQDGNRVFGENEWKTYLLVTDNQAHEILPVSKRILDILNLNFSPLTTETLLAAGNESGQPPDS